jgi:sucrose phosphorylase
MVSQAIMLALKGVPGIYVHSLLGSQSWHEGVVLTGRNRTINREKLDRFTLERELADPASLRHSVFSAYRHLLQARSSEPAFHPQGIQQVLELDRRVFALLRVSPVQDSRILCAHNVSADAITIHLDPRELGLPPGTWCDLLSGETLAVPQEGLLLPMSGYGIRWLKA